MSEVPRLQDLLEGYSNEELVEKIIEVAKKDVPYTPVYLKSERMLKDLGLIALKKEILRRLNKD